MNYELSANNSIYLSIVVPLYNEEECVDKLVSKIVEVGSQFDFAYELILVDDGSTDKTWQLIEDLNASNPNLKAIKLRRNYGQTVAMVSGFDRALGEIIVTMDGDLQNDPADIPKLIEKLDQGYNVVCGWRKDRKDKALTRVLPSKVANWIISKITGVPIHDSGCSLKAYRSSVIKSVSLYSDMHRFIPAMVTMVGARIAETTVNHNPRKYGESKYGLSRVWKVLFDIVTIKMLIKYHNKPMLWFGTFSFIFGILGLLFGCVSIFTFLLGIKLIIYPTSSFLFFSLFGSFLSWGILAEFLIRQEKR
jgi:glycosyltransferase involved in cell wall biosynthesis